MPAPDAWDTPGLTYDSGVTWGSLRANRRKPMNSTKAIIDYSGYVAADLGANAHVIHDQMTASAVTFTAQTKGAATPGMTVSDPPTQAETQALADKLDEFLAAARR